jgi:alcohol dehydrogenase class IV
MYAWLRDDTDLWSDRGRSERYGTRPACAAEDAYPRPGLSRELPPDLSLVSGLDATAHAARGLYAHDGNPAMSVMADD